MTWPTFDVPQGFTEQFLACDWLCFISPTLRQIGPDRLRIVLRRWFESDYTPKDVVYALDHLPTGEPHQTRTPLPSDRPRTIENWVIRRLREWLDADDDPLPPVNSHIAHYRDERIARQLARREEGLRVRRLAANPHESPGAARARVIAKTAASMSRARRFEADERELRARRQVPQSGQSPRNDR